MTTVFNDHEADASARSYLQALLRGKTPPRPEHAGRWIDLIRVLDEFKGNAEMVKNHLTMAINSNRPYGIQDLLDTAKEEAIETNTLSSDDYPPLPEKARLPVGLLPQVSPWIADYIVYSRLASPEGHEDFHLAGALFVLSTIAARRIYVPLAKRIHTPLALALVARTSLFAKTTTAEAASKVLRAASLGWLLGDDETTPQKLLADMAGHIPANYADLTPEKQERIVQRLAFSGQLGWYYDEFNQLINTMTRPGPMQEFAGLLRKLDNCPDEYRYSTRAHGRETIEKPYLALLANTTPANLKKHASAGAEFWNDGFWARIAFLCPPAHTWKTHTMPPGEIPVPGFLSEALRQWNERLGIPACTLAVVIDEKGKDTGRYTMQRDDLPSTAVSISQDAYDAFKRYREALRVMIAEASNHDLDGSYVRLPEKALRIAVLIASLEHKNRISLEVWTVAQEIAELFRSNLHELYNQINTHTHDENPLEEELINYLKKQKEAVTVRTITHYGPGPLQRLKAEQVKTLLQRLIESGIVEKDKDRKKGEWFRLIQ